MTLLLENVGSLTRVESAPDTAAGPDVLIEVGPGPRNARTDPNTGLRYYTWQGRELPSVTTVRRLAGMPHKLHNWTLSQVVDRAVDRLDELQGLLSRPRRSRERVLEKNRRAEAAIWLRAAATEERDAAAKLGTAVHDAAAADLLPDAVEPALRPRLLQFRDWLLVSGASVIASEFQVFSPSCGYAGTVDLLARFPNGQVWLVDIKTGNGVYNEHALQVVAYANADVAGADDVVDETLTAHLGNLAGTAILHLADDHWEFHVVRNDPAAFHAFLGLLAFAVWTADRPLVEHFTTASRKGVAAG